MTKQLKLFIKFQIFAFSFTFISILIVCGVVGFVSASFVSYISMVLSLIGVVSLSTVYAKEQRKELDFLLDYKRILLLLKLRNNAILDFYLKNNIAPRYKADGSLMTPDELLGFLSKIDAEGKLNPLIYEKLGILPIIGPNGKEIPAMLVIKHIVAKFKTQDLNKLPQKFVEKKSLLKAAKVIETKTTKKVETKVVPNSTVKIPKINIKYSFSKPLKIIAPESKLKFNHNKTIKAKSKKKQEDNSGKVRETKYGDDLLSAAYKLYEQVIKPAVLAANETVKKTVKVIEKTIDTHEKIINSTRSSEEGFWE